MNNRRNFIKTAVRIFVLAVVAAAVVFGLQQRRINAQSSADCAPSACQGCAQQPACEKVQVNQ